jgi:S1-C subfamily serine protease
MGGRVIGINTAIISPVGVNAGIGLAIPSNIAKQVMHRLTGSEPASDNNNGSVEAEMFE